MYVPEATSVSVPTLLRPRPNFPVVLCVLCAAAPALAMLAVGKEPFTLSGTFHFVAVGGSALAATAASIVLTVIGARQQDGRTVLVGTAFAAMAALLFLHGLASPGVIVGYNGLIALSGAATLPVGAAVLGLSSMATSSANRTPEM